MQGKPTLAPPSVRQGEELVVIWVVVVVVGDVTIIIIGIVVVVVVAVDVDVVVVVVFVIVVVGTLQVLIVASAVAKPHSNPVQHVPTRPCIKILVQNNLPPMAYCLYPTSTYKTPPTYHILHLP